MRTPKPSVSGSHPQKDTLFALHEVIPETCTRRRAFTSTPTKSAGTENEEPALSVESMHRFSATFVHTA